MGPHKIIVTGMKLETLKGRSDRPTTSRRLTEAMLVKAIESIAIDNDLEEEEVFASLLKGVGAASAKEEAEETANEGVALIPDNELKEILDGTVEDVEVFLINNEIAVANLNRMISLEKEDKNRKGIIEAIEAMLED